MRAHPDAAARGILLACVALRAWAALAGPVVPAEDAAILMRYAAHLAAGDGIVWNPGDPPVDGATDFLFLLAVAGVVRAGAPLELATRAIGLVAHLFAVNLVYGACRATARLGVLPSVLLCSYLAIGPGVSYVAACFGTTLFAALAALQFTLARRVIGDGGTGRSPIAFGLASLLLGLARPEGVLLAALVALWTVLERGWERARSIAVAFIACVCGLGTLYLAWRQYYFGHFLPHAFLVKGGGAVYPGSLAASVRNLFQLCLPFSWVFVLALRSKQDTLRLLRSSIPIVGFIVIWGLLSNETNIFMRFQYAALPLALLAAADVLGPAAVALAAAVPGRWLRVGTLAALFVSFQLAWLGRHGYVTVSHADGRLAIAQALREVSSSSTLCTTEAGLLPLYSGWRTLDAWGLNDSRVVAEGGITESYLDAESPAVIVIHEGEDPSDARRHRRWQQMVTQLKTYASRRGYLLAAAFGVSRDNVHLYYVRRDLPVTERLTSSIRAISYAWPGTSMYAINFAIDPIGKTP